MSQIILPIFANFTAKFPDTKYMGSKQKLLPYMAPYIQRLKFKTVLDAFSGTGCVSHFFKHMGAEVYANDFLKFCYHIANATIENNSVVLNRDDIAQMLKTDQKAPTFIRDTYQGLFFDEKDCQFLDNLWINLKKLDDPKKKSLALSAATRACMKKRPRGLFTFVGQKGWDGRLDLKLSMEEQFLRAALELNKAVFTNGLENKAWNRDVFDLPKKQFDLVYLDPPYVSQYSDCDYTRRYHFLEGFCTYWKGVELMQHTKTKKIKSYSTSFSTKDKIYAAFQKLFSQFRSSIIVLSYSSNCLPTKGELVSLLMEFKKKVEVFEIPYRYNHGNQRHKVLDNNNQVNEYLFIAQ